MRSGRYGSRCALAAAALSVEPGRAEVPGVTNPDIWYSYNDNASGQLLGTPCQAFTQLTPGPNAPGSLTECPRLLFRAVDGGATGNNLFNIDYAEFNGTGVGTP